MKKLLSLRGYIRAVLLSIAAACLIETMINADEVRTAFAAGKGLRKTASSLQETAPGWLNIPQHISRGAGRVYHLLFE